MVLMRKEEKKERKKEREDGNRGKGRKGFGEYIGNRNWIGLGKLVYTPIDLLFRK